MMRKILCFILLLTVFQVSFAQGPRERIKALKTAHITTALDLSESEAQKFWPIYNASEEKITRYKRELRQIKMNLRNGDVSDNEAEKILTQFIDFENKIHDEEINLINKLRKVVSAKKVIKLKKAEDDFNRKVLEQLKRRRGNNRN